ncbi:MAG: MOSC domain-containing protein [Bacteroidetes bacterium]|jgi:MOSC domain-containing protein YiiM|nr:MOSC domain-containing protein [Bacteroidota bacterium]MBT4286896.1 MOSC domain-containing protein [Deltaproteobacteria bacterium]MBT4723236.1 MOSC domain-containing protein [Candidatus Falkowbacteria bacterium]
MESKVIAVSSSKEHVFSKQNQDHINLIKGIGVEGDAHAGKTVQHLFLVKKDSSRPNIRQVHLIQAELFSELSEEGFSVGPGQLGENITTKGIDLLNLPVGSKLYIGESAIVELTALRNPCHQIDKFQKGLLKTVVSKDEHGKTDRKAGVMGIVLIGGKVKPNDIIKISLPDEPHNALEYVW